MELTREQAIEQCKGDLNFFSRVGMPDVHDYDLPPFYTEVWFFLLGQIISVRDTLHSVFRFALGLPRGHAKTTFSKLLVAYGVLFGLFDFVLIVGSSEDRAQDILDDINNILGSPNIRKLFGDWNSPVAVERDTREVKIRNFLGREVILAAVGAGTALRGINIRNRRPGFILLDDVQTKENDESPTERDRLLRWILSTLLKSRDPKHCFVFYIGNMYSEQCILKQLQNNRMWTSLITGAILADGTALWPELHPLENLLDEYEHDASLGKADIWFAEIMNDPQSLHQSLFPEGIIPDCPYQENQELEVQASFITIDPAGFRDDSDDNVVVCHKIVDDLPMVAEIRAGQWDPETTILEAIDCAIDNSSTHIGIESVAYQQTLKFWMELYLEIYGLSDSITVLEIKPGIAAKHGRIRGWVGNVLSSNYYILRSEDRALILYQGIQYRAGKKDNQDDILDGCAFGDFMLNKHREELEYQFGITPSIDQSVKARVVPMNTPMDAAAHYSGRLH
jgi:hypothetical protein